MRIIGHKALSGAVTSLGKDWELTWKSLLLGERNFQPMEIFLPVCPAGPCVSGVSCWNGSAPPMWRRANALASLTCGLISGQIRDLIRDSKHLKIGLIVGTSNGEPGPITAICDSLHRGEEASLDRDVWKLVVTETVADTVRAELQADFPSLTLSAACASAGAAIGIARDFLICGHLDCCLIVTVDALSRISFAGFDQIGAMSRNGCRPFDETRDGTTVGEGGAVLLLSREGVIPVRENDFVIGGFGINSDARHAVEPSADGVLGCLQDAMADADLKPFDIKGIIWHGSGTIQNDAAEAEAAKMIFGSRCPPGTGTKGSFGHCMGASGCLNVLAAAEAITTNRLPPVGGLEKSGFPELNLVVGEALSVQSGPIISVALGFGGTNSALVLLPV